MFREADQELQDYASLYAPGESVAKTSFYESGLHPANPSQYAEPNSHHERQTCNSAFCKKMQVGVMRVARIVNDLSISCEVHKVWNTRKMLGLIIEPAEADTDKRTQRNIVDGL